MTTSHELEELTDAYFAHLEEGTPPPDLSHLNATDRAEVDKLLAVIRNSFGALEGQPDLRDDPVRDAVGFNRDGATIDLAGAKVRRAREQSGLDYADLILRMNKAGSRYSIQDLFRLERATSTATNQPDATALVVALGVNVADIEVAEAPATVMERFLASPEFDTVVQDWCDEHRRDFDQVAERARNLLVGAQFRGGNRAGFDDLIDLLMAFLAGLGHDADTDN